MTDRTIPAQYQVTQLTNEDHTVYGWKLRHTQLDHGRVSTQVVHPWLGVLDTFEWTHQR